MSTRRSLLIDGHAIGAGQTGNETWAYNVLSAVELDGRRDRVHHLLTERGKRVIGGEVDSGRVHVVSEQSWRRLLVDVPCVARGIRPGALLCHYTRPPGIRVPTVVVVHDVSFHHPRAPEWIPARSLARYRVTIGHSVRKASVVLAPTEHARTAVIQHYRLSPDSVVVAGNAVAPNFLRCLAASSRIRGRDGPKDVLVVGTILPRKNILVAARAVAALRKRDWDVRLRLVGPIRKAGLGELDAAKALLGASLICRGEVSLEALVREYLNADVLAMPSLYEGFGIPLLEAMAAGLPVVCSNTTSLPEVAGGAALLVDPEDQSAWTAAIELALNRPEPLVELGLARAGKFSWSATASVVLDAMTFASG